jgi:hypothetical protein
MFLGAMPEQQDMQIGRQVILLTYFRLRKMINTEDLSGSILLLVLKMENINLL